MKTVTEYIRERILAGVRPDSVAVKTTQNPREIMDEQVSFEFLALMSSRMVTGYFRYGTVKENKFDSVGDIPRRLRLYQESGNLEYLVDVANLAMVEFLRPLHPKAHFDSIDDGEHVSLRDTI